MCMMSLDLLCWCGYGWWFLLVASSVLVDLDCLARNGPLTCCLSESLAYGFVIMLAIGAIATLKGLEVFLYCRFAPLADVGLYGSKESLCLMLFSIGSCWFLDQLHVDD
ncbi:hypothetical protein A2U01_0041200 [Trifolium medium]|uniref:Uncharacterized protein n=1 Tax=Trifolium medium TaxID=97028 RepID=A0A392Q870_9FABA|nr:hypothetical protein [Trifolium medium]